MSGYYDGGHPMLSPNSPMFAHGDGGPARVADRTRTWKDERADEIRRRSYRILYRLVFPRPIPILSLLSLADNDSLGWR